MPVSSGATAHVDTLVRDRSPRGLDLPEFMLDNARALRLNCGAALIDAAVEGGMGERPCLIDSDATVWTYAEVGERANRLAGVLTREYRLVPGQRVLLRGPNCPWLAVCWLAVQKAGLIAVVTMPLLRTSELRVIVAKAHVNLALCDHRFVDELAPLGSDEAAPLDSDVPIVEFGTGTRLEDLLGRASPSFANCDTAADDPCLIAFTSGTTGQPKGCVHLHRDVLAIADTFSAQHVRPTAEDVFAGSPPLAFTFGLGGLLIFPLRVGAASVLLEVPTPPALASAIERHKVSVLFTAPTAYRAMLEELHSVDISSLRVAVSAGEPLPLSTRQRFERATGLRMIDGLGATEMLHVFISASGDDVRDGAIGRAVNGFEVAIHDDAGSDVGTGVTGRLAVKGPTGCRYLDDPRQAVYVQRGWNYPGDAMTRDEDGYFWYQARADDMIISSGYNIAGPEVEAALLSHEAVAECACVGVADEERGMVVKAFIVLRDMNRAGDTLATELQAHVKATIAPYKYPRRIEFRSDLPKTATGKLQRYRLRTEANDAVT